MTIKSIDCYMQKRLHTNLTVTISQKPLIDMRRIKRKKSKCITKENKQSMKKNKKGSEKIFRINHKTSNKMAIGMYVSIITLNVNGLNAAKRRHRMIQWVKKKRGPGSLGGSAV